MSLHRIAVIDLGSNTFHLLICSVDSEGKWKELYRERQYVKLAADGLETISEVRIDKAISVMNQFVETIRNWNVEVVRAIGTAALREATNGTSIIDQIKNASGIKVEIIDGKKEAEFILKGIQAGMPVLDSPALIMDIGGGSVEFILYHGDDIFFQESYKIGVAILFNEFHKSNPMSPSEQNRLLDFLDTILTPLTETIAKHRPFVLVGASGSFEVILDALPIIARGPGWAKMDNKNLISHLSGIIGKTTEQRRQDIFIPAERVDYVVVAYLLIKFIWEKYQPESLFYCEYALKEGVISEMVKDF